MMSVCRVPLNSRAHLVVTAQPTDRRVAHVEGERYVSQALSGVPARQGLQGLVARQLRLPAEPHAALSRPSLPEANERVVPVVQLATMRTFPWHSTHSV